VDGGVKAAADRTPRTWNLKVFDPCDLLQLSREKWCARVIETPSLLRALF
jgi:hypothetical protein